MQELNSKLHQYAVEKKQIENINSYLTKLDTKIDEAHLQIKNLDFIAEKEARDVQKLEDNTLRSMFIKILGQNDKALEFEKQEMLLAYINLNKAKESLEILDYERKLLTKKLLSFDYDPILYEKLIKLKEQELDKHPKVRHKIVSIDLKLDRLVPFTKEVEEAKEALAELNNAFKKLHKQMATINDWNEDKYYLGKGDHSSYMKKKFVKSSIALISEIEILTEKVNLELNDLKRSYKLDLFQRLAIINNFFEVFFDNLLTDWIVRKGLKTAKKTIEICNDKITRLQLMLDYELEIIVDKISELKEKRDDLIISTK